MDINKSDKQELDKAITRGDVQLARRLILDNNVEPINMNVSDLGITHFIQLVAKEEDKPLLDKLVKHNSKLAGKALWRVLDNIELAKKLVHAGANVNYQQDAWPMCTLMHILSESHDPRKLRLAELMMDHNADVDAVNGVSNSVLQWALRHGAPGYFIGKLLSHSRASFQTNLGVITGFHRTAELVPLLIAAGSPDEAEISRRAHEALFYLVKERSCEQDAIKALFESHNITVDVLDGSYFTPLYYATKKKNRELVELLLKLNADPNKIARGNLTSLIKHGGDLNQDDDGEHPIHFTVSAESFYGQSRQ